MIYVVYHHPGETMGLISEILANLKLPYRCVHLYRGDGLPRPTSDLDALVLMGGPMSVNEPHYYPFIHEEIRLLERVLADGKPILGICLGAQLIVKALGGLVFPHSVKEVGWHSVLKTPEAASDAVVGKTPGQMTVFQWHGETFDLPQGAAHLFKSDRCPNQAFRWGNNVYGFQFHLEVTPVMVQDWCQNGESQNYIREAGEDPETMMANSLSNWNKLRNTSVDVFSSFFESSFRNLAVSR